jgi:hypothetical protein
MTKRAQNDGMRDGKSAVHHPCWKPNCDGLNLASCMMTLWEKTKESLGVLPLLDAAYQLWMQRHRLDREETPTRARTPANAVNPPDVVTIRKLINEAIPRVIEERKTAHEGKTFTRLKAVHPEANDDDLKAAIKRAVMLDIDCVRNFSYMSPHYFDDCRRAVELSRAENPGFSDETYRLAEQHLMFAMR